MPDRDATSPMSWVSSLFDLKLFGPWLDSDHGLHLSRPHRRPSCLSPRHKCCPLADRSSGPETRRPPRCHRGSPRTVVLPCAFQPDRLRNGVLPGHRIRPVQQPRLRAVVACIGGQEGSRLYEVKDGQLTERGQRRLAAGEGHTFDRMPSTWPFNCWAEPNIVLHVYGGDFLKAAKTVYDPLSGDRYLLSLDKEPPGLIHPGAAA